MNVILPKPVLKIVAEVIQPGDKRHPSNPEHPHHQLWLEQTAAKKVKVDDDIPRQ